MNSKFICLLYLLTRIAYSQWQVIINDLWLSSVHHNYCTILNMSVVILNKTYTTAYISEKFLKGDLVQIDLFFLGTWSNEVFQFYNGKLTQNIYYTSPSNSAIQTEFCDDLKADFMTINFTIPEDSNMLYFTSFNSQNGSVAVGNVILTRLICYPSCRTCTGEEYNQCTDCFYGQPVDNICPPCPSDKCQLKYDNCEQECDYLIYRKIDDGFYKQFTQYFNYQNKFYQIFDYSHVNFEQVQESVYAITYQYNSGFSTYFNLMDFFQDFFLFGIKLSINLYLEMPIGCGIQFKVNNSYYGSIYKTRDGYQYHNVKLLSKNTNLNSLQLTLYMLIDLPKYIFTFTVIGNYNDSKAGWRFNSIQFFSGLCPRLCKICELSYKCKVCYSENYVQKDGTCSSCNEYHQKNNGTHCLDIQKDFPFSKFLVSQKQGFNPIYYQQFQLINQNGSNFLKGKDIFYQYDRRIQQFVFGGQFIWAQVTFRQIYIIKEPHHSLTIGFFIQFGSQFPTNGCFKYTFDQNQAYNVSKSQLNSSNKIEKTISQNQEQFSISFECFGPDNEPIKAYCGFYGYYIIVHNCQPNCLNCTDQFNCTIWNSTDYPELQLKDDCQSTQYYDEDQLLCLPCPSTCLTCISEFDCSKCKSNYTLQKYRCICKRNEYEEEEKCLKCPDNCNQCLNPLHCLECSPIHNRQLSNTQCICYDGYYSVDNNPVCLRCNKFCKTCYGPEQDQCIECNNIDKIQKINNLCKCPSSTCFGSKENACLSCHLTCQTCFSVTSEGCLSCNIGQNRILRGLSCVCKTGYYEKESSCFECPDIENSEYPQCYKQCKENKWIWFKSNCAGCDPGFELVNQGCKPICGDLQVQGYEKCDDGNTKLDDLCFNCQYQCPIHCTTCNKDTLLPCPDVCGDGIITGSEECEDGNNIKYDGCYNCKYQCQDICTKCIKGLCYECKYGWQIDPNANPWVCKEVCGDGIVVGLEKCDPGTQHFMYLVSYVCKNCQFQCGYGCTNCSQINGQCKQCQEPGLTTESYYCITDCGDGILVRDKYFNELCDYGKNTDRYHGCNDSCQFQCQNEEICLNCENHQCQVCAPGYDLIIAPQQCEDSTDIQCIQELNHNKYQYCRPQCQSQCLICSNSISKKGTCYKCKKGYQQVMGRCLPICGDQIVLGDEECDDGNFIYDDGCHQCLFTCHIGCQNCIQGQCYDYQDKSSSQISQLPLSDNKNIQESCLVVQKGYKAVNGKCLPICNDKIIVEDEQCDDGNLIYKDGCHQCLFSCDDGCSNCVKGTCYKCSEGFSLFSVQNSTICIKLQDQKTVFKQQNIISIFILNHLKITRFQNKTIVFPIELSSQELNITRINQHTKYSFYFINETISTIYFKIEFKCQNNETIFSKFINYKHGSYNKKLNLSHQCGSKNGQNVISYEIGIKRELTKKEQLILSILIEDELCIISSVVQKEYQRILLISFNNNI